MAQPVFLSPVLRSAARRADGSHTFAEMSFALNGDPITGYDETWRPAKSLIYVFATCAALWVGSAVAYIALH
jgi:hypothetical protein